MGVLLLDISAKIETIDFDQPGIKQRLLENRKVSHWHDASFLLEFSSFPFCFFSLIARGLCSNNQKFKSEVLHNLPKALITIEEHM